MCMKYISHTIYFFLEFNYLNDMRETKELVWVYDRWVHRPTSSLYLTYFVPMCLDQPVKSLTTLQNTVFLCLYQVAL